MSEIEYLTPRASQATENLVILRSIRAKAEQLRGSMINTEYGITIPERQHLISLCDRHIDRCAEIIAEEDNRV